VVSRFIPAEAPSLPAHSIDLDQNPGIRNSVGPLSVRARQTKPPSFSSDPLIAGTLIGPQIDSIGVKRKPAGSIVLKIEGTNFSSNPIVLIRDAAGNSIAIKAVLSAGPDLISVKLRGVQVPPGAVIRVTVAAASLVKSNEVEVTAP
jgi:hypothetical protein